MTPTAPSVQSINLVLQQASNGPLQNLAHAQAVSKALGEVEAFFKAVVEQPVPRLDELPESPGGTTDE